MLLRLRRGRRAKEWFVVVRGISGSSVHLFLVELPLVLLVTGTLIELLAFLWRKSSVRIAAKWMIGIGAIVAVPTVMVGFYDFWRTTRAEDAPLNNQHWQHTRLHTPVPDDTWDLLRRHAVVNGAATLVLLLVVIIWLGGTDSVRHKLHVPLLIVTLACVAIIVHENFTFSPPRGPPVAQASGATSRPVYQVISPLHLHLLLGGIAIALAAAALGLSFRAASHSGAALMMIEPNPGDEDYAAAFMARNLSTQEIQQAAAAAARRMQFRHVPAGRYWVLTFLLVATTVAAGVWTLSTWTGAQAPRALYEQVVQLDGAHRPQLTRRFAHTVTGVAILLLPLILALAARFSPRRGFIAAGFGFLLAVAIAAQVWFGSLLMLDSPQGPLNALYQPPQPTTQSAPVKLDTQEPATQPTTAPAPPLPSVAGE